MIDNKHRKIETSAPIVEQTVHKYFKLIKDKDINKLLELFADDAVVYEPFSNIHGGLRGKSAIRPFLEVAIMANDGLQHEIEFEKSQHKSEDGSNNKSQANAFVTFERGGRVQARFVFKLVAEEHCNSLNQNQKKIRSLHIQFIK